MFMQIFWIKPIQFPLQPKQMDKLSQVPRHMVAMNMVLGLARQAIIGENPPYIFD